MFDTVFDDEIVDNLRSRGSVKDFFKRPKIEDELTNAMTKKTGNGDAPEDDVVDNDEYQPGSDEEGMPGKLAEAYAATVSVKVAVQGQGPGSAAPQEEEHASFLALGQTVMKFGLKACWQKM